MAQKYRKLTTRLDKCNSMTMSSTKLTRSLLVIAVSLIISVNSRSINQDKTKSTSTSQ